MNNLVICKNQDISICTFLNLKEINRIIKKLSSKAVIIFIILNHLINKQKNGYRNLSNLNLKENLPFKISDPTLKKNLDLLRLYGFIKSFQDIDTKHHVYSLVVSVKNKKCLKINDFIINEIFKIIVNHDAMKLYVLIYLKNNMLFHNELFTKTLKDLCRMMGLRPTKGNKDAIKRHLNSLINLNLINYTEKQKHIFLDKKITIGLKKQAAMQI
jgi:hypothetical protein